MSFISLAGQRSRVFRPRLIRQPEALQLLSALRVDRRQVAVLLSEEIELLLKSGDLNGNLVILHQLCQELAPEIRKAPPKTQMYSREEQSNYY